MLTASVSDSAVRELLNSLADRDIKPAMNRALNRAATTLRTDASREVRQSYAIRARDVNNVIAIEKASGSRLTATVRVKGKQIPLSQFGAVRQTKRGVTVTVKRGGGRTLYPHAFLATGRTGREVFWRTRQGGRFVPRGPIKLLLGPSVAQIVSAKPFTAKLLRTARERIVTTLQQEIRYRLTRVPTRFT